MTRAAILSMYTSSMSATRLTVTFYLPSSCEPCEAWVTSSRTTEIDCHDDPWITNRKSESRNVRQDSGRNIFGPAPDRTAVDSTSRPAGLDPGRREWRSGIPEVSRTGTQRGLAGDPIPERDARSDRIGKALDRH